MHAHLPGIIVRVTSALLGVYGLCITCCVGGMSGMHLQLVVSNMTTNEYIKAHFDRRWGDGASRDPPEVEKAAELQTIG